MDKKEIPVVGKEYQFYDDGKVRDSRRYTATILRVIPFNEGGKEIFDLIDYDDWDHEKKEWRIQKPYKANLIEIWKKEVKQCYWLYATETDFFVEASIPKYDDNNIWFARTKCGGWFSMDIQSSWQGGELDVDNSLTEELERVTAELMEKYGK